LRVPRVVFNPCGLADVGRARLEDKPWHPDSGDVRR
jgi:hypothetical protein